MEANAPAKKVYVMRSGVAPLGSGSKGLRTLVKEVTYCDEQGWGYQGHERVGYVDCHDRAEVLGWLDTYRYPRLVDETTVTWTGLVRDQR